MIVFTESTSRNSSAPPTSSPCGMPSRSLTSMRRKLSHPASTGYTRPQCAGLPCISPSSSRRTSDCLLRGDAGRILLPQGLKAHTFTNLPSSSLATFLAHTPTHRISPRVQLAMPCDTHSAYIHTHPLHHVLSYERDKPHCVASRASLRKHSTCRRVDLRLCAPRRIHVSSDRVLLSGRLSMIHALPHSCV